MNMTKVFSGIDNLPILEKDFGTKNVLFVAHRAEILFDKKGVFRFTQRDEKIEEEPSSQLAYVIGRIKDTKEDYILVSYRTVFRNETPCVLRDECLQVPISFILAYKIL